MLPSHYEDQWSLERAAFRDRGPPQVDLVLTRVGSKWDAQHRLAWDRSWSDARLLDEYARLKASPQRYAERKTEFFERIVGLLPQEDECRLGGHS